MKRRLHELVEQRRLLVARCAEQRSDIAQYAGPLRRTLRVADIAADAGRALKRRPLLVGAIITSLTVLGPGRAMRWLSKGLAFYSLVRNVRSALRRV
jgi:hypothetical protein